MKSFNVLNLNTFQQPKLIGLGEDPRTGAQFDVLECLDTRRQRKVVLVPHSARLEAERGILRVLHEANVLIPVLRAQQTALINGG